MDLPWQLSTPSAAGLVHSSCRPMDLSCFLYSARVMRAYREKSHGCIHPHIVAIGLVVDHPAVLVHCAIEAAHHIEGTIGILWVGVVFNIVSSFNDTMNQQGGMVYNHACGNNVQMNSSMARLTISPHDPYAIVKAAKIHRSAATV